MAARRIDALHELANAIGFIVAHVDKTSPGYSLFSRGSMRVWCQDVDGWWFADFNNCTELEQKLLTSVVQFEVRAPCSPQTRRIDNPYYGCKSLEEALIRKDLLETCQLA